MLVSENIVRQWYRKDSWVYTNFVYLFQNPLWSTEPPKGFSVCPYFWISLFSFLILRPIVIMLTNVIGPLFLTVCGRPFMRLDRWLLWHVRRILIGEGKVTDAAPGMGVLFIVLLTVITCVLGYGVHAVYKWYFRSIIEAPVFLIVFWSVVSGLAMLIGSLIHAAVRDFNEQPRCRTEAYLYVWAVLVLVAFGIFASHESIEMLHKSAVGIWAFLAMCARGIGYGLTCAGQWLWEVIVALCGWLRRVFAYRPSDRVPAPWWTYIVAFAVVSVLYARLADRWIKYLNDRLDESDRRRINRQRWLDVLAELMRREHWIQTVARGANSDDAENALTSMAPTILRRACELHWSKELDILQECSPNFTSAQLVHWKQRVAQDRIRAAMAVTPPQVWERLKTWTFVESHLEEHIYTARKETQFSEMLTAATLRFAARRKKREAKREAKRKQVENSAWHKLCVAITTSILDVIRAIGRTFAIAGKGIWRAIRWTGIQIGIFFVYLWTLVKARKQGACPYFHFEEEQKGS